MTVEYIKEEWAVRVGGEGGGICVFRDRAEALREQPTFNIDYSSGTEVVCRNVKTVISDWEVVKECQFNHAHTREWCGNRHCRES